MYVQFLLAEVLDLEVCDRASVAATLVEWEHECTYIVHLVLATLVVVECLLVECLDELTVYKELCHSLVTADCYVSLLAWVEAVVLCVEVTVARETELAAHWVGEVEHCVA